MGERLTLGSLFDGSGGFPLAGLLNGVVPLWASEIEPFPIRVTTKRLPFMRHIGDISRVNGAELEPVDIITFGSPCQDMSVAGRRAGLDGAKSSLFYQAVRVIREMRCATNGAKPRYIVWENVPGAFSSNKGEDFRAVLQAICSLKGGEEVPVPQPAKWENAGEILGDGYSVAWRVLDAQYWGVPQRRRRIFLVADFAENCAGKILFESEGMSRHLKPGFQPWKETPRTAGEGAETASGTMCLNDQGGDRMDITNKLTCTLRAESHHPPCILDSAGFCAEHSAKARSIGYESEKSPTIRAGTVPATVYENHSQDTRYTELTDTAPTVSATYGMGGNNQPFVVETPSCFDVRFTSEGTRNARQNVYETTTSRTIDTGGNPPDSNQGGVAVVSIQGSMIGRADGNGPQGSGLGENVSFTLNTADRYAVAFSQDAYDKYTENEKCGSLRASGGMYGGGSETLVCIDCEYVVRRLTPTECARLQGFPDWWCSDLAVKDPSEEEMAFWRTVFETHRSIIGTASKAKTDKQIKKWLSDPYSDSAEYKMWGNGVALPCVCFVIEGIVNYTQ